MLVIDWKQCIRHLMLEQLNDNSYYANNVTRKRQLVVERSFIHRLLCFAFSTPITRKHFVDALFASDRIQNMFTVF